MTKITVYFEPDPSLNHIDVVIRAREQDAEVTALMERLSGQPPDTIAVFDGSGTFRALSQESILSAYAGGKLVTIVTENGTWYTRRTLQNLEETLDKTRFLRVSRHEIVNLDKVLRYDFTLAGTLRLELVGGMETWASRRCIPAIRKRLLGKGGAR